MARRDYWDLKAEKEKLNSQMKVGNASASKAFAFDRVDKDLMKASFAPQNISDNQMSILGSQGGIPNPEALPASTALQINPGLAADIGQIGNVPAQEVFNPSNMKEAGTFADALKGAEAMEAANFKDAMSTAALWGKAASVLMAQIGKGQDQAKKEGKAGGGNIAYNPEDYMVIGV